MKPFLQMNKTNNDKTTDYNIDDINISFLSQPNNKNNPSSTLPLIITPRSCDSHEFLCEWLKINRPWVQEQILKYGAVLIRGFQPSKPKKTQQNDITDPSQVPIAYSAKDLEKAILSLQPDLCDKYRGTSPRSLVGNTHYMFSAADAPVNYPIAQHLEMSFLKQPPRQLYFGCLQDSKGKKGGETALCDFRKVYQDLPSPLREKFYKKKLRYTRKHKKQGEKFTYDVGAMLSWVQLFSTADKDKVTEICEDEGAPQVKWVDDDQNTFLQEWNDEPFQLHPDTNEPVWFNHSQVFHWTTFPCELWFSFCRVRDLRLFLHFILVSIFTVIKYGLFRCKMALNTTFGDGTPISFQEMNQIREAIHRNMVFSRWEKGDILCIDNFSTSHGRQPTYDKGRKIVVAWSHPFEKNKPISDSHLLVLKNKNQFDANIMLPDLVSATPGSSPESTLTEAEAVDHRNAILDIQAALHAKIGNKEGGEEEAERKSSLPTILSADSDFWKKNQ
eukprot:CAMPEP_0178940766 /NCGR_PEP_ID=MMETSP0789-20121207/1006_1 /TAXON_ID=3005 /ORGANISM="Rhizosolenia setigera, Strain CCMP 1694" /LENGTH=500 /DNA_ID=CAMNT_0020619871 /DNA_START=44 /DNA_END=1546 /DNA_ORIENTATION=-